MCNDEAESGTDRRSGRLGRPIEWKHNRGYQERRSNKQPVLGAEKLLHHSAFAALQSLLGSSAYMTYGLRPMFTLSILGHEDVRPERHTQVWKRSGYLAVLDSPSRYDAAARELCTGMRKVSTNFCAYRN